MAINPTNIDKVKTWPVPTSVKEVEQFLGFVNYHRDHIQNYAVLYHLTGSKAVFKWEDVHQKAFEELKLKLISAPLLAYPNSSHTFVLDTDASSIAISGVLSQIHDGVEKIVSYESYVLTPAQRKWLVLHPRSGRIL